MEKKENQNMDLKLGQKYFDEKQSGLMVSGVEEPEAILLTTENKIQKVVTACNKSHNGPIIGGAQWANSGVQGTLTHNFQFKYIKKYLENKKSKYIKMFNLIILNFHDIFFFLNFKIFLHKFFF